VTPRPRLDIGVDLDGVCYDFAASLRWWLASGGRPWGSMPDPTCWHFYSGQWGMTLPEFIAACDEATNAGYLFAYGHPELGTRETLERFIGAGHRVHLITDRSFGRDGHAESNTRYWLAKHSIPFDSLTFTADKTAVPVDTMIDDKPENYDALEVAGHYPWLRSRPWNAGHAGRRVESWADFAAAVDRLARVVA